MPDSLAGRTLQIIAIDDDEDDVELMRLGLARSGLAAVLARVADESQLMHALAGAPDLLLCDYNMPGFSAERVLALLEAMRHPAPLIVVTRAIGEEAVVGLFRAGAKDYVAKDKLALLPAAILRVWHDRARERAQRRTADQLADAYARLRKLSEHIVDAQERERGAVARELHDGLGQTLTGILIHLQAAARSADRGQVERCQQRALGLAREAIDQVKTLSFTLRPAQLELLGVAMAVRATLEGQLEATGIRGQLRLRGTPPAEVRTSHPVALRILQESLTNVIRHAQARHVLVRLRFMPGGRLALTVADDGRGFDVEATLQGGVAPRNFGLYGMLERAELLGGQLRFRSRPGRGSVVRFLV